MDGNDDPIIFIMLPIYIPVGEKEYSHWSVNPLNVDLSWGLFREYVWL